MPEINARGDFAHGVGGALANVNNQPFAIGGVFGWIDDDTVGFSSGQDIFDGDNWCASKYHRPTGLITRLSDPPSGANHGYCGGGHAAWWWGHRDPMKSGLYSTTGFREPAAGLLGMGPDGAIGYKPNYQSNGPTRVRELNGDDWLLTDGHAADLRLLGSRRAVWLEGFTLRSIGLPTPPVYTADGGIWKVAAAFAGGRWWISYFSGQHGIVLHPFDSFTGFRVLAKGNGWHNLRAISDDVIRVIVSSGIAEQAGQLWGLDYNVRVGTVCEITSGERVPALEESVDIRTINAFDLTPMNRPMWLGFFEFGPGEVSPGNCTIAIRNVAGFQARPVVVSDESVGKVFGTVAGYWVSGSTVEEVEAAARLHPNALAYWDARRWPRWPTLPPRVWLGFQAYCLASETPNDFLEDMRRVLRTAPPGRPLALIAQCYTSNTGLTTNLRALVPVYNQLALEFPQVIGVFPFTGAGRATGLPDHPEVRALWGQFAAGIPAAPPIPLPPVPPRPPVPPPVPPRPPVVDRFLQGDLLMLSTFLDPAKGLIPVKTVKPVSGTKLSTLILPDGQVFSCQPDGSQGVRDPGTEGGYEKCAVQGNVATFKPDTKYYSFGFVLVDGL